MDKVIDEYDTLQCSSGTKTKKSHRMPHSEKRAKKESIREKEYWKAYHKRAIKIVRQDKISSTFHDDTHGGMCVKHGHIFDNCDGCQYEDYLAYDLKNDGEYISYLMDMIGFGNINCKKY